MRITKRIMAVMLVGVVLLQAGAMTAFGENAEDEKQIITISNIDTSQLTGEAAESSTEIGTEGISQSDLQVISEEWTGPAEYVISGSNISIKGGKYSYKLVIRSDRTLTFDNDLEIYYQGIDGRYKLHYDIDETDNHTMIVTGTFDNIIISSPLLQKLSNSDREWILSHISRDSYFYQLVLKTKEGFSFINMLRFFFDAKQCGYSAKYSYDLLTDRQTLIICGIPDCDETVAESVEQPADKTDSEPADKTNADNENAAAENMTNDTPKADEPEAADTQPESIKTVVIRYSKLRRKAQTIKASELFSPAVIVQGRVTYVKVSGNKRIKINKKSGKVTVKKGLKKGTYYVTVKLKSNSKTSANRSVSFAVKVI